MEKQRIKNRSPIAKIFCLCIVLMCVFAFASCDLNENKSHDCTFSGTQLNSGNQSDFVTKVEGNYGQKIYTYYLGKSITLTNTLQIPEGTFVGICTAEFTITAKSNNTELPLFTVVYRP